jgi:hypothetical protein
MKATMPQENTRLVLAVTLGLWGGGVTLAAWEGVFAKLGPVTFALLVAFAIVYAAATYALDRSLHAAATPRALWTAALLADAVLAVAAVAITRVEAPVLETLARFPYAIAALFVAPLAVTLHAAALGQKPKRLRSARARSPGANPAAT